MPSCYAGFLILSALLLLLLPLPPAARSQPVTGQWVSEPPELQNITVSGVLLMSASPCSQTCGLGWRSEYLCKMDKDGNTTDCLLEKSLCLVSEECGLSTRTLAAGEDHNLSCVDQTMEAVGLTDFTFVWRIARGVVTTDNFLFKPYPLRYTKAPWLISFKPLQERNAGTYMCEVQNTQTMEVVKRVLSAVKVIPVGLVELDFFKALTDEQRLELEGKPTPPMKGKKMRRWWLMFNSLFGNFGGSSVKRFVFIGAFIGSIVGLLVLYVLKRR